jgi:hypothetical protein
MRKFIGSLAAAVGLAALSVAPAQAVTGNYVEDFEHESVGLVVFYDEAGKFLRRCSGTLIAPTVFLTAGHCTDGADSARVYFAQDAGVNYDPVTQIDPVSGYPEYCEPTNPAPCVTGSELYNYGFDDFATFPDTHDVGLVILDEPILLDSYPALAAPGELDQAVAGVPRHQVTFTVSGYGLSQSLPKSAVSFRERLMATSTLVNLGSANTGGFNLQTTANPGGGKGGTCSGDSGGPIFFGSTDTIVAVTSFGMNAYCRGVDFSYRTDQQAVIDWILEHAGTDAGKIQIVSLS